MACLLCDGQTTHDIRTTSEEVLLDLIVRDRGQRLVRDLSADQVEVYEDGVQQQIRTFRYVSAEAGSNQGTPARDDVSVDAMRQINLVTVVFQAMNHDALRLGQQVIDEFLNHGVHSNTYVAIFTLNNRLALVQPYTRDTAKLRAAVDQVVKGNFLDLTRRSTERLYSLLQVTGGGRMGTLQSPGGLPTDATFRPLRPGSAEERGPGGDRDNAALLAAAERVTLRMLMYQQGSATLDALRTVVRELAPLPGRKSVLYLSTGLVLPPDLPEWFRNVVSEANRANVSFYTVDTRGLDTAGQNQYASAAAAAYAVYDGIEVRNTNAQQNLFALAEDTGGFAMANSNDLRAPVRRMMEDVRSHYELTYTPISQNYDGHFRRIEVKLRRPGLKVQTREGYFALPALNGRALLPHEFVALRAIESGSKSFVYRAAALRARPLAGDVGHLVVFEIPAASLQLAREGDKIRIHASMLALIRDTNEQVVAKVSRDLNWTGPAARADEYRSGNLAVRLPVELPPGRYSMLTGVVDRLASTASTRRSVLVVPRPEAIPMSDLVLVRRVEPAEADPLDPLAVADGVVTPDLSGSAKGDLTLYFAAWPGSGETPQCTVQIRHNGSVVSTQQFALPTADAAGTARALVAVPAAKLGAGQVEVAVQLERGEDRTLRRTTINVE